MEISLKKGTLGGSNILLLSKIFTTSSYLSGVVQGLFVLHQELLLSGNSSRRNDRQVIGLQ